MRRVALLAALVLAGCGGDPEPASPPPRAGVEVRALTVQSDAVGRRLEAVAVAPRERTGDRPLLVLLHGQGASPESMVSEELVAELERLGERAPVVLAPDGDESSYWHDRDGGAWARMVVGEAIPEAARRFGAEARRVAVAGFSMGGFGALHLAERHPRRFCSVAAHSPAVFRRRPTEGSPFAEAFDDAADFERADLIEHARGIPAGTWVDVGDADPFAPAVRDLVARMRAPRFREWRGNHELRFWLSETPRWMAFHLARCRDG